MEENMWYRILQHLALEDGATTQHDLEERMLMWEIDISIDIFGDVVALY
jgi:hypothetical protein